MINYLFELILTTSFRLKWIPRVIPYPSPSRLLRLGINVNWLMTSKLMKLNLFVLRTVLQKPGCFLSKARKQR